jgi:cytokinin dehydrogenase
MGEPVTRATWSDNDVDGLIVEGLAVSTDPVTRQAASTDFGNIVRGRSRGVVSPRTAEELAQAIHYADARQLSLAVRATGQSAGGQTIARDSMTLDVSRLDRVSQPDIEARTIRCEPGARWRSLLAITLPHGLVPSVMPLNLDLTVGGTLSVGGVGSNSCRLGTATSTVVDLEAVSGDGRRLRSTADPELLDVTLGNIGRCAVMTSLTLSLRPAEARVRTYRLLYDTVESWLSDMRRFRANECVAHMDGFCSASAQGFRYSPRGRRPFARWFYGLHVSVEYGESMPDAESVLHESTHRWSVEDDDLDLASFMARADPRFDAMARTGTFALGHPWIECFLPVDALPDVLPRALDALPLALGDGHRLALIASTPRPRFLVTPTEPEIAIFAVLPMGVPTGTVEDVMPALRAVNRLLLDAGGKRYLAGWIEMDAAAWEAHYGDAYDDWVDAKRRYDPHDVLSGSCCP